MYGHTLWVSRGSSDFVPRQRAERCWIDGDLIRLGAWPVGGIRPGGRAGPIPWLIELSVLETAMRSVYGDRFRLGARAPLLQMTANLLAEGDRRNAEAFAAKVSFPLPDYAGRFHDACAKHLAWGAAHRPGNPPIDVAAWVERVVALEQKFDPNQPRVPRGHPEGGQWTDGSLDGSTPAGLDRPATQDELDAAVRFVTQLSRLTSDDESNRDLLHLAAGKPPPSWLPPRWDNLPGGIESSEILPSELPPPVELPPGYPKPNIDPVPTPITKSTPISYWSVAKWVIRTAIRFAPIAGPLKFAIPALDGFAELAEKIPEAVSYFDPPKTLEELQDSAKRPAPGYHIHHIIEQNQQNANRLNVDSPENKVRIPTYRHQRISDLYSSVPDDLGGLTVREWVRSKSPEFQREYGLWALKWVGAMK